MNSSAGPSIDYYKADKCGVCGIKTWYNDEEGFRTCKKGHQDQSFRQTQNAEEEYLARGSQGQTTRMRRDQQEKQTRCEYIHLQRIDMKRFSAVDVNYCGSLLGCKCL